MENIGTLRAQLQRKEKLLLDSIDQESTILESRVQKNLKKAAMIGAGLAIGVGLYKLLSPEEKSKDKKTHPSSSAKRKTDPIVSKIGASLVTFGIKKILPLLVQKLESINSTEKEK